MILRFDEYLLPVLKYLEENGPTGGAKVRSAIQDLTGVTPEERSKVTSKGTNIANSRVYWAIQYLFQAGALVRPSRGVYAISSLGVQLLADHKDGLTLDALRETDGFQEWIARSGSNSLSTSKTADVGAAPQELVDKALTDIEKSVGRELVARLQRMEPEFLEKTVLKLLGAMGYGIDDDSLQHTGGPGDEGVDGIINQDRLGLQRIYVQAKRYKDGQDISRETLQAFVGASQGAAGGIFITTSAFRATAKEYAEKIATPKIVIIDGQRLGELMVKYGVGAMVKQTYSVYEVDENFFDED